MLFTDDGWGPGISALPRRPVSMDFCLLDLNQASEYCGKPGISHEHYAQTVAYEHLFLPEGIRAHLLDRTCGRSESLAEGAALQPFWLLSL